MIDTITCVLFIGRGLMAAAILALKLRQKERKTEFTGIFETKISRVFPKLHVKRMVQKHKTEVNYETCICVGFF